MGFKFDLVGAENLAVKADVDLIKSRAASRFLKYSDWYEEIEATGEFLEHLKENRKVKGVLYNADAVNVVNAIEALTKVLVEIQKKTPVVFSNISSLNGLKKMGIATTTDTIVLTDYKEGSWLRKVDGHKSLKDLGWSKSKAVDYAKKLADALKNVGKQNAYETWVTSVANAYTSNKKKDQVLSDNLTKVVKQAQHVFEARHRLIVDARKLFMSLKKHV